MRGIQKGEENAKVLQAYFDKLELEGQRLPARDGKPNLSLIAAACGLDRGVFYTNEAAKLLLDSAIVKLRPESDDPQSNLSAVDDAKIHHEAKARVDARTKALEDEVIRLSAENVRLRTENDQLKAIRRLMADAGRVP